MNILQKINGFIHVAKKTFPSLFHVSRNGVI